jgi:hypothetical protein
MPSLLTTLPDWFEGHRARPGTKPEVAVMAQPLTRQHSANDKAVLIKACVVQWSELGRPDVKSSLRISFRTESESGLGTGPCEIRKFALLAPASGLDSGLAHVSSNRAPQAQGMGVGIQALKNLKKEAAS